MYWGGHWTDSFANNSINDCNDEKPKRLGSLGFWGDLYELVLMRTYMGIQFIYELDFFFDLDLEFDTNSEYKVFLVLVIICRSFDFTVNAFYWAIWELFCIHIFNKSLVLYNGFNDFGKLRTYVLNFT